MIILDTNIISELIKPAPDSHVLRWFDNQQPQIVATTAITAAELSFGVNALPMGKRKTALRDAITAMLEQDLEGQILPFDTAAAQAFGILAARLKASGTPIGHNDTMIAAITLVHDATLITRNSRHFENCGIEAQNPFSM